MLIRLLRQAFILVYIFLTICALVYTLSKKQVPHVKWPFVTHFYAMMAPFQNYTTDNAEMMIYGQDASGHWTKIDYQTYFPFGRGEYAIRIRMTSFGDKKSKYTEIARRILEAENANGAQFTSVRMQWEKWPKSQYDFYGNYTAEQVTKNVMAEYFTQ
ncbi:MAG: hypothetical protein HOG89_00475 [Candidatus Peribacter sp.]|nr:hypothetical protein [Candidatus Peribacter sp.]MBT4392999.1 hypothetical protein [Candidatus Peribacter sp.]MBT4601059.1 hypothetical protein [Candidatus Peribacter sp.]MBT5149579.1 hypothetical protein [Candidatus Peribacter sp.]MBT5637453.1 hypothetical protein [Candidatus Peribacter sp.]